MYFLLQYTKVPKLENLVAKFFFLLLVRENYERIIDFLKTSPQQITCEPYYP